MDSKSWSAPNHRKRKRRRGVQKPPLNAHVVLDARVQGNVGVLAQELFDELFPWGSKTAGDAFSHSEPALQRYYVAITPASQITTALEAVQWTIVPVKRSASAQQIKQSTSRATLQFSPTSTALQHFSHVWHTAVGITRPTSSTIEVRILDVVPIGLDNVYVTVDSPANDDIQKAKSKSRGGPMSRLRGVDHNTKSMNSAQQGNFARDLQVSLRKHLQTYSVLHTGDILQLSTRSSPKHSTLTIELCEPVSQGIVLPHTKIVITSATAKARGITVRQRFSIADGIAEEDPEETSNEQYHTAVEDPSGSPAVDGSNAKTVQGGHHVNLESSSDTEASSDDLSDGDDAPGVIGLSLPTLPSQGSGGLFPFSSATPRGQGLFSNGIGSPGSVISGFSMSTVMGGGTRGKLFQACGLSYPVSNNSLHPKPANEEDEEARIYTDTTSLKRLGCFSGDWVRLEAAPDENLSTLGSWGLGAFENEDEGTESRCVRIYALPGDAGNTPRYSIDRSGRSAFSHHTSMLRKSPLRAFLSPILLANLGSPPNIRIAPMAPSQGRRVSRAGLTNDRITIASTPPVARDVILRKYSTPAGHDRGFDSAIKWALGEYFTKKHRAVKSGDLIAISFSESLGRAINQGNVDEDASQKELVSQTPNQPLRSTSNVAWFKVGAVHVEEDSSDSPWEGLALIRADITKLSQAGDEYGKLPNAMKNPWQYYLGIRRSPSQIDESHQSTISEAPRSYVSSTRRRLRELLSVATSPQATHFSLPPVAILLASTQRHIGKATIAANTCSDLGLHLYAIDAYDILSEGGAGGGDVKTTGYLEARVQLGLVSGPEHTVVMLKHIDVLTAERMTSTIADFLQRCRILIATTTHVDKMSESMRNLFTHEIEIAAPDEGEREGLLHDIVQESGVMLGSDVDLSAIAVKTAALVAGDLVDVVDRACVERQKRLQALAIRSSLQGMEDLPAADVRDIQVAGGDASRCVCRSDFDAAVDAARKNFADAIGAPKIPNVTWDDVGGLSNVKDAVMETIQLPLERPELFAKGMKKRSGILFYGPPGTGKTLLAKAIATEFSLNFFSVKGPELLNMYIGESEANVRRVFQRARDARPCVVFFDELDSVAPKRGNQGDSGGVMDRIVSQLLAELDGMSNGDQGGSGVFVIGATNRPDLLDQALLRPGRFDKMLYLGISDTHEKQWTILQALTRKFALAPSLSLQAVSERLPFTYTGADLYALCSDAMLKAITRKSAEVDTAIKAHNKDRAEQQPPLPPISIAYFFDHLATAQDTAVVVEQADFEAAQSELVPSVSLGELEHYERVRRTFESNDSEKKTSRSDGGRPHAQGSDVIAHSITTDNSSELAERTRNLSLNGSSSPSANNARHANGAHTAGAKGKGKEVAQPHFGFTETDDSGLYD